MKRTLMVLIDHKGSFYDFLIFITKVTSNYFLLPHDLSKEGLQA